MNYEKLDFDDHSISFSELIKKFDKFVIYESKSNNHNRKWLIMNFISLRYYIKHSAKEIFEIMEDELNGSNFEDEIIYGVRIIDSKTLTILEEFNCENK